MTTLTAAASQQDKACTPFTQAYGTTLKQHYRSAAQRDQSCLLNTVLAAPDNYRHSFSRALASAPQQLAAVAAGPDAM